MSNGWTLVNGQRVRAVTVEGLPTFVSLGAQRGHLVQNTCAYVKTTFVTADRVKAYHARQCAANCSSSLGATPTGVAERFRADGGGVVLAFLAALERPAKDGEVGDVPKVGFELPGGGEGRS
jgi:hypothetical protein